VGGTIETDNPKSTSGTCGSTFGGKPALQDRLSIPNTCRTDTFMSGQTGGFLHFGHGGGRHQSSEVSDAPETRFAAWLRMGARVNLAGEQGPARSPRRNSKFHRRYHLDRCWPRFFGRAAQRNHAALFAGDNWPPLVRGR